MSEKLIADSSALEKLLILSSFGGYGHIAATNTLKNLLSNEYEIDTIYPIKELRIMGMPSGEAFYNYTISNNWTRFTNWYVRNLSFTVFAQREKKTIELIEQHIEKKRPDLIISVIPFVNYPAAEAARKFNIPFLLVTTDNDLHNWVFALQKRKYENFKVTIGANLSSSKGLLLKHAVTENAIETTGLPLRPNFLNPRTKRELKKEYDIATDKKVILITMGGVGCDCTYQYAQVIMQSALGVHLVVCTGKNRRLAKQLKEIIPVNGNSIAIIPFTEKIHELFALSDLVISKPGPGTINEVFSLKIPILIDYTRTPLFWEKVNIDWVLKLKVGGAIRSLNEVVDLVKQFLFDEKTKREVASAYDQIPQNQFGDRIKPIIEEMCSSSFNFNSSPVEQLSLL